MRQNATHNPESVYSLPKSYTSDDALLILHHLHALLKPLIDTARTRVSNGPSRRGNWEGITAFQFYQDVVVAMHRGRGSIKKHQHSGSPLDGRQDSDCDEQRSGRGSSPKARRPPVNGLAITGPMLTPGKIASIAVFTRAKRYARRQSRHWPVRSCASLPVWAWTPRCCPMLLLSTTRSPGCNGAATFAGTAGGGTEAMVADLATLAESVAGVAGGSKSRSSRRPRWR